LGSAVNYGGIFIRLAPAGKSYLRGRLSTVYLLILTSLDQLFFIEKNIYVLYKTSYFNDEVKCTEPSPQLVFPGSRKSFVIVVLTSLDQLLFKLKKNIYVLYKTSYFNVEFKCAELSP